ncbi:MAG: MBL fold metallo-hydrolase [Verrucomicrobia bacterium]|nr:MBL fold metallo-hydrolase [Verrucomicrobiota bacterium]
MAFEQAPHVYDPESHPERNYLKFWGTRGSVPVSGQHHVRYGGNTVCLEIHRPDQMIIIDAGTGIKGLGDALLQTHFREIHLLIGHAHWDHIIGFPFFQPIYHSDFVLHIYGPHHGDKSIEDGLKRILEPHHFPVQLGDLQANDVPHEMRGGQTLTIGDTIIDLVDCDHPGGALGFRFQVDGKIISYITDNEFIKGYRGHPGELTLNDPIVQPYLPLINFCQGVDLLIHEAQYTPRQYSYHIGWGHSSISNAAALVKFANIKEWVVTHHDPSASDDLLRERHLLIGQVLRDCNIDVHCLQAHDELKLPL